MRDQESQRRSKPRAGASLGLNARLRVYRDPARNVVRDTGANQTTRGHEENVRMSLVGSVVR